jgi:hypothetical protein
MCGYATRTNKTCLHNCSRYRTFVACQPRNAPRWQAAIYADPMARCVECRLAAAIGGERAAAWCSRARPDGFEYCSLFHVSPTGPHLIDPSRPFNASPHAWPEEEMSASPGRFTAGPRRTCRQGACVSLPPGSKTIVRYESTYKREGRVSVTPLPPGSMRFVTLQCKCLSEDRGEHRVHNHGRMLDLTGSPPAPS